MSGSGQDSKRRGRTVGLGDALGGVIDPVLAKRGFASRDLIANWGAMAPQLYRDVTFPDKLVWKRGAGALGGTLYLRCAEAQRLAVTHDAALIAGAVNRYFGYVLVEAVKLSAEPFSPSSGAARQAPREPSDLDKQEVAGQVDKIEDEDLKAALRRLGHGLKSKRSSG